MKIIYSTPESQIARVYVAELEDGSKIEFVESVQPPSSKEEKFVIIVSTLKGCPINCSFCDAGGYYNGRLTYKQILDQIYYVINNNYADGIPRTKKLKIQFARMGEPAFNLDVLKVLETLPNIYDSKILMPSISTIAPRGCDNFFNLLIDIKKNKYPNGQFQMQFSIHTTDTGLRKQIIPAETWNLEEIARYGEKFWHVGDRKITLNFATPAGYPADAKKLLEYFDPERYLIKITPVNPTKKVEKNQIRSLIDPNDPEKNKNTCARLTQYGYDVILSIGEIEENNIGSNCGMYIDKRSIY